MEKLLKSQRSKKPRPKYAYVVAERSVPYTALGDPIIFGGQEKYVCGACMLLLKNLDVRFWSRSPLLEMHQMPLLQMIPYAFSKCGCELNMANHIHFSSRNYRQGDVYTSMALFLTCHCLSEIRALVDGLFPMERSEVPEFLRISGEKDMWMREKLTVLESWQLISPDISPRVENK